MSLLRLTTQCIITIFTLVSCSSGSKVPQAPDRHRDGTSKKGSSPASFLGKINSNTSIRGLTANPSASQKELDFITQGGFTLDQVGFILYDPQQDLILSSHNADDMFMPASVTKLVTGVLALETLGADYKFKTELWYEGDIEDGVLEGNLYLKGKGDPFLLAGHLKSLVHHLKAKGIKKVDGNFYYDQSTDLPVRRIASGFPDEDSYNPGLSSLSSEFNRFSVFKTHRRMHQARIYPIPDVDSIALKKSRRSFDALSRFKRNQVGNVDFWTMSTRKRYSRREDLPVRQPALHTAQFFQKMAETEGIQVGRPSELETPSDATLIHAHPSKRVDELTELTLEYSNNVMAELLFNKAKSRLKVSLTDWFTSLAPDLEWRSAKMLSGSGISLGNRFSPKHIAAVLSYAQNKIYSGRSFASLFPISGWKGSLRNRMTDPDLAFRVWGKTGSIDYISGLGGYVLTSKQKPMVFAIFVNDRKKRGQLNTAPPVAQPIYGNVRDAGIEKRLISKTIY